MGLPAALHQRPHCTHHRTAKADIGLADDGVTAGFRFNTESLQKAGQAFFTTKLDGLGLGLSISKAIAEQHQGQLAFDNATEGGAVVTLLLPMQR
jgi:C4-dicarboxylate-specific signal transduction histidine kinase